MLKYMMPAAVISLMAVSSAWALPAAAPAMNHVQGEPNVIEVQYHHGSAKPNRSMHHRQNIRRGHSYRGRHYAHRYNSPAARLESARLHHGGTDLVLPIMSPA